jgi:hypothetical protein
LPKTVADSIFGAVTELRTMFLPEPPLSILAVPQEIDGKHCDPLVTLDTHPPHLGEPGGSGLLDDRMDRHSFGSLKPLPPDPFRRSPTPRTYS